MRHTLVRLEDAGTWTAALAGLRHAHAHTHAHAHAFAASSPDETLLYVGCEEDGTPIIACPLSVRGEPGQQDVYTPFGFSGFASDRARPEFGVAWDEFAASQGWIATYALQHPSLDHDLGLLGSAATVTCYLIDLSVSVDVRLSRMARGGRTNVRRALRAPFELSHDRDELAAFVLAEVDAFFDARDAASLYRFSPETWRRLLAAPSVRASGVRIDGAVVAALIVGRSGDIADGLFTLSVPAGRGATTALVWDAFATLAAAGATTFNMGGGVSSDDGVAEFKRRLGGAPVAAHGIRLVHRQDAFDDLCRRAGVAPDLDGFFPPYRRRQP
jgi:hypothetical protein